MAFADWKKPKPQAVIDTEKTPLSTPTIATIATIADEESIKAEVTPAWSIDKYATLITCQQCEHLAPTGYCRVKPQYKPLPDAMRDCVSFETVKGERVAIANAPYSASELNDLLSRYEKKLF
jgi:hypothetical protein